MNGLIPSSPVPSDESPFSPSREERRDLLFDFAVDHADGFTVDDVAAHCGWQIPQVNTAIRDLRQWLADVGDTINLPCNPQGRYERWRYNLVGSLDEVRGWTSNRVTDAESRLRTMSAMMATVVNGTDGRTVAGRKARVMERALNRLVEDLDQILTDSEPLEKAEKE